MANYHIGLDFGTSQTKVCLFNKDSDVREFLKFDNNSYFLPTLIVKKQNNTFPMETKMKKVLNTDISKWQQPKTTI